MAVSIMSDAIRDYEDEFFLTTVVSGQWIYVPITKAWDLDWVPTTTLADSALAGDDPAGVRGGLAGQPQRARGAGAAGVWPMGTMALTAASMLGVLAAAAAAAAGISVITTARRGGTTSTSTPTSASASTSTSSTRVWNPTARGHSTEASEATPLLGLQPAAPRPCMYSPAVSTADVASRCRGMLDDGGESDGCPHGDGLGLGVAHYLQLQSEAGAQLAPRPGASDAFDRAVPEVPERAPLAAVATFRVSTCLA